MPVRSSASSRRSRATWHPPCPRASGEEAPRRAPPRVPPRRARRPAPRPALPRRPPPRRLPLTGAASASLTPNTTLFGIFQEGDFAAFLSALRRNSVAKILAEPNLVALNGHQASFLAGGQFPVPSSTFSGSGAAVAATVS